MAALDSVEAGDESLHTAEALRKHVGGAGVA